MLGILVDIVGIVVTAVDIVVTLNSIIQTYRKDKHQKSNRPQPKD